MSAGSSSIDLKKVLLNQERLLKNQKALHSTQVSLVGVLAFMENIPPSIKASVLMVCAAGIRTVDSEEASKEFLDAFTGGVYSTAVAMEESGMTSEEIEAFFSGEWKGEMN